MQLPGPLGGFSMRLPSLSADAAFYSTWASTHTRVRTFCSELGRPSPHDTAKADAEAAAERLHAKGILVKPDSSVPLSELAQRECNLSPWSKDISLQELTQFTPRVVVHEHGQGSKLMSRTMRCLELTAAGRVYNHLGSSHHREVMLSSGGTRCGKV